MAIWKRFHLNDFPIGKNGKPYIYGRAKTYGIRGLAPTSRAVFFPNKVKGDEIVVPADVVWKLEHDSDYEISFPPALEDLKMGRSVIEEIENMPIEIDKFALIAQAIQSENETVIFYQNLQEMFPEWKDVLQNIIDEELKHIGQFEALRDMSSATVADKVEQGQQEADAQMSGVATESVNKKKIVFKAKKSEEN